MAVPHSFPALLDASADPSVLIVGAGMSSGIAPSVDSLAADINAQHAEVVRKLGVDPSPPPTDFRDFYDWAERAFDALKAQLHLGDDAAKVRLANSIGVTTDPRYQRNVESIGLRQLWARHRVSARFAREGRWRAIWSLNWDCVLESALECVGLRPHPQPGTNITSSSPWNQWYLTWSPGDAFPPAGHHATVYVCKPHGCVRKIRTNNPLFIVIRRELQTLTPRLQPAAAEMNVGLSHAPLFAVGWRADEDYICANIEALKVAGTLLVNGVDRLSVINRTWYPLPPSIAQQNHQRLAVAFGVTQADCFFEVGKAGHPTMDDLFRWAQTRYYLQRLRLFAQHSAPWAGSVAAIAAIESFFAVPRPNHVVNAFVDDFVSVWLRLCFNAGRVVFMRHGVPVPQAVVATDLRDEHIPWMYDQTARDDMLATIPLLLAVWQGAAAAGVQWSFDEFPGALWDEIDGHLILPLPAWSNIDKPIDLAGLKPLVESRNWGRRGAIRKLSILPLRSLPADPHFPDDKLTMRSSVAALMKSVAFANPANLFVSNLAAI
jgi:hypothetical protein